MHGTNVKVNHCLLPLHFVQLLDNGKLNWLNMVLYNYNKYSYMIFFYPGSCYPYFTFMYMHYNHCHQATAHLQLNILL